MKSSIINICRKRSWTKQGSHYNYSIDKINVHTYITFYELPHREVVWYVLQKPILNVFFYLCSVCEADQ